MTITMTEPQAPYIVTPPELAPAPEPEPRPEIVTGPLDLPAGVLLRMFYLPGIEEAGQYLRPGDTAWAYPSSKIGGMYMFILAEEPHEDTEP